MNMVVCDFVNECKIVSKTRFGHYPSASDVTAPHGNCTLYMYIKFSVSAAGYACIIL